MEPLRRDLVTTIERWEVEDDEDRFRRLVWKALAADPALLTRRGDPAHFTASVLPVTADARMVCLVLHGRMNRWVQPGGHLESSDTSMAQAAGREMAEETGLSGVIDPIPLWLSRHAAPCAGGRWHLDVQFVAMCDPSVPVVSEESHDVAWFDAEGLPDGVAPGVPRLVAAAKKRISRIDSPAPPPSGG